jgi:hypothetical protein
MTDENKKKCDLIQSKYEEISKILSLLELQLFFDCTSTEKVEKEISLTCIKGYN